MSNYIKPRMQTIPIYQGDDLERISDLRRTVNQVEQRARAVLDAAKKAAESEAPRAGDPDALAEARAAYEAACKPSQDAYDAFVLEAAERACMVEVHAIGSRRFRELRLKHPARMVPVEKDPDAEDDDDVELGEVIHEDDRLYGVNTETFPMALLTYVDAAKRTIVKPDFASEQEIRDFLEDEVEEGDISRLWIVSWHLNRSVGADPKGSLFSPSHQTSSET